MSQPKSTVEATCLALVKGRLCGDPATRTVRVGCVHEHVRDVPVCDGCADGLAEGLGVCLQCFGGADPHECAVIGRRLP